MGAVLRAVRQSEILVRSVGIDSAIYKLLAFVIACFFAGIAGSFYAHYLILAHPDAFSLWDSIYAVAYVVIGGTSTVLGPILGTALLIGGFELLREAAAYQTVGYALILLLVTRFLPGGLISLGPMSDRLPDPPTAWDAESGERGEPAVQVPHIPAPLTNRVSPAGALAPTDADRCRHPEPFEVPRRQTRRHLPLCRARPAFRRAPPCGSLASTLGTATLFGPFFRNKRSVL